MGTVHTYDVFNIGPMTGNQLAVFTGLYHISQSNMQKLAKEMNYAESVFLGNEEDGGGGDNENSEEYEEEAPANRQESWSVQA